MAYTALNLGYIPTAGYEYTATTDSSADWPRKLISMIKQRDKFITKMLMVVYTVLMPVVKKEY
jgi:hypothetical protein